MEKVQEKKVLSQILEETSQTSILALLFCLHVLLQDSELDLILLTEEIQAEIASIPEKKIEYATAIANMMIEMEEYYQEVYKNAQSTKH